MSDPNEFTVAWICALSTEFVAACALLDEEYPDVRAVSKHDDNNYKLGRFGSHRVVITVLPRGECGLTSATGVARDMVHTFTNLRFGFMVGIGGGAPTSKHPIRLGDVIVSQPTDDYGGVIQYDFGKNIQGQEFANDHHLNRPPRLLLTAINTLSSYHEKDGHKIQENIAIALQRKPRLKKKYARPAAVPDRLYRSHVVHPYKVEGPCSELCSSDSAEMVFRDDRTSDNNDPEIFYGLIASANRLMKDAEIRDKLAEKHGILCFEMEAAGLMNHFPCLVIRGICDYADTHKNDDWQGYAAMTAAAYTKELLSTITPQDVQSSQKLTELVERIHDNTKAVADHNRQQSEQFATSQLRSCLQVFKTSTYEMFKDRNPDRAEQTCLWVFEHPRYKEWLQNPHSDLLWLSADPGCGKSVFAKAVVDDNEFSVSAQATVCYFFFKDNEDQDGLTTALCALLHQLFSKQSALLSHALRDWEKIGDKIRAEAATLWRILENAATDSEAGQVICVLDALDECREQDRQRLIDFLCRFYNSTARSSRNGGPLKFIVTSRPYDDQEEKFYKFPEIRLRGEDENEKLGQEINRVIRHRLQELKTEIPLSESVWQRLTMKLLGMEHRTYLWFDLAIADIRETYKGSLHPDEEKIEMVPSSVHDAYEKILTRVTERRRETVRKALSIILSARRPFSLGELSYALGIATSRETEDLEQAVISRNMCQWLRRCCGLFVYVSGSKVYLIHQTAKEFLLDQRGFQGHGWRGSFEVKAINHLMGTTCIYALCSKDFQRYSSGETRHSLTTIENERDEKHCFLSYCAEFWVTHLGDAYDSLSLIMRDRLDLLHDVASKAFQNWFGVMWKACFPLEQSPEMTKIRLCAFTGHYRWLEQELNSSDDRLRACDAMGRNALYWSCFRGYRSTSQLLIDKDADVNALGGPCDSALGAASSQDHGEIAKMLIEHGADVNIEGPNKRTPLHYAALHSMGTCIELLLQHRARVTADVKNMTAFHYAVRRGDESVTQKLLDAGVPIDIPVKRKFLTRDHSQYVCDPRPDPKLARLDRHLGEGLTALHYAVLTGNARMTQFLFEKGADINALSEYSETPLHIALKQELHGPDSEAGPDDWNASEWRIEDALTFTERDDEEYSEMQHAIREVRLKILETVLNHPDVDYAIADAFGDNPIHCIDYVSSDSSAQSALTRLLDHGIQVDLRNSLGRTALHLACLERNFDAIESLLDHGASILAVDNTGLNALHCAAGGGDYKSIQMILDIAERLKHPHLERTHDNKRRNALHHLFFSHRLDRDRLVSYSKCVDVETTQLLTKAGVDINLVDDEGYPPLASYLRQFGLLFSPNVKLVEHLFQAGADPSFRTSDGLNLGHISAHTNKLAVDLLRVLREHGVDLQLQDNNGRNILHHCALHGSLTREDALSFLCNNVGLSLHTCDNNGETPLALAVRERQKDRPPGMFRPDRYEITEQILLQGERAQS